MQSILNLKLNKIPKWLPIAILIISLIGFADATYLTIEHYQNKIPPCTTSGCETVLTSQYSEVFGVPVSLFGSVYYLVIAILVIAYLDTKKEIMIRLPMLLSVLGFISSLWFVFVMAFLIKSYCQYCLVSASTSTIIFLISAYSLIKFKEQN